MVGVGQRTQIPTTVNLFSHQTSIGLDLDPQFDPGEENHFVQVHILRKPIPGLE